MYATFAFPVRAVQSRDNHLQEMKTQGASLLRYETETEIHILVLQHRRIAKTHTNEDFYENM